MTGAAVEAAEDSGDDDDDDQPPPHQSLRWRRGSCGRAGPSVQARRQLLFVRLGSVTQRTAGGARLLHLHLPACVARLRGLSAASVAAPSTVKSRGVGSQQGK